jgi:hypothetical protein
MMLMNETVAPVAKPTPDRDPQKGRNRHCVGISAAP